MGRGCYMPCPEGESQFLAPFKASRVFAGRPAHFDRLRRFASFPMACWDIGRPSAREASSATVPSPMFAAIPFISRQPSFHPSHSSPCLVPLPGGRRGKPLQVLGWRDSRRPNQFLILVAGGDPTGVASTRFRRATR